MSHRQLEQVILRSMKDEEFLDQLAVAPEEALADFGLTEEEVRAVASGDEIRLNELLGLGSGTAHINANQYHHSQHRGGRIAGLNPDLLPRVISE